jgi:non-specific serine/threonine protein kinase
VRLLNTIREFAYEQLELSGERNAMRQAHATWYAQLVIGAPSETWRTGTPELRTWTLRYLPDLANFTLALDTLVDRHDDEAAVRMVSGLVPFWLETGQLRDGSEWTARLMPQASETPLDAQALFYRMAAIMAFNGDTFDEANRLATLALTLAEQVGQPRLLANSQNLLGQIRWRMGNAVEGERLQRAAITTIQTIADPLAGALFASQIAESLIEEGDLDRAEPLLREAMPVVERERPEALPILQGTLGYLALKRGDLDEASLFLERSLDYHRLPPHRLPGALAGRLLSIAELAMQRGAFRESARLVGAGMGICDRIGIVISAKDLADVETVLAQVRPQLGPDTLRQEEAIGKALPLPEAIALAIDVTSQRSGAAAVGAAGPGSDHDLTPRELEVLALLAEGKSNPAIAGALFISQRTVTTHLSRLYAKLDVSTRSEAIALAVRLGIVPSAATRT